MNWFKRKKKVEPKDGRQEKKASIQIKLNAAHTALWKMTHLPENYDRRCHDVPVLEDRRLIRNV